MQRSAFYRSRRELSNDPNSNEYLHAKIGVDTAENEPLEVWGKIIQYYSFVSLQLFKSSLCSETVMPRPVKKPYTSRKCVLYSHGGPLVLAILLAVKLAAYLEITDVFIDACRAVVEIVEHFFKAVELQGEPSGALLRSWLSS